jgi:hypothetical protein
MNTKGVMVDPAQPRLFIDKTKAVTAYGGDYESRLKLALEYIQSHPGSAVHLEIEDKRGKYLGEYSINSQGLQYLGPIGGNERPGFFTRIWRLFKEKPKIDPDTFVRQIP